MTSVFTGNGIDLAHDFESTQRNIVAISDRRGNEIKSSGFHEAGLKVIGKATDDLRRGALQGIGQRIGASRLQVGVDRKTGRTHRFATGENFQRIGGIAQLPRECDVVLQFFRAQGVESGASHLIVRNGFDRAVQDRIGFFGRGKMISAIGGKGIDHRIGGQSFASRDEGFVLKHFHADLSHIRQGLRTVTVESIAEARAEHRCDRGDRKKRASDSKIHDRRKIRRVTSGPPELCRGVGPT